MVNSSIKMEATSPKAAPEVPLLRGEKNFDEWKIQLAEVFKFYGLSKWTDSIHTSVPPPRYTKPGNKGFVLGLISSSVLPVASRLEDAGWDFSKLDQDPYDLYCLISSVLGGGGDITDLVAASLRQFVRAKPSDFTSLESYGDSVDPLKTRLDTLGSPIGEALATWVVIDALFWNHPDLSERLAVDMKAGCLSWRRLMQQIDFEIAEMANNSWDNAGHDSEPYDSATADSSGRDSGASEPPYNSKIAGSSGW